MAKSVAIVGGGVAGLRAAHVLREQSEADGLKLAVEVLEARGRLGGRVETRNSNGIQWDRGAEFIDANNEVFISLARALGVSLTDVYGPSAYSLPFRFILGKQDYTQREFNQDGEILFAALAADFHLVVERKHLGRKEALRQLSVRDYLDQFPLKKMFREAFEFLWEDEMGAGIAESSSLSMLDLELQNITQDQDGMFERGYGKYRVQGGCGRFVEALAAVCGAKITLNTPISGIIQRSDGKVVLRTSSGDARECDAAIVATPIATLKKLDLSESLFSPQLREFIDTMPSACHEKTIVQSSETPPN